MEAKLVFFFPKGTRIGNDDYETWKKGGCSATLLNSLGIEGVNWQTRDQWLKSEGVMLIPYTTAGCYKILDNGQVIMGDPNGKHTPWSHDGFVTEDWLEECPFEPEGVQAWVYWWCHVPMQDSDEDAEEVFDAVGRHGPYPLGDLPETHGAKGSLDLEVLRDGRRRYKMWVEAPSFEALNRFVSGVRTGEILPEKPWLG